jgi:hypothetical protein
MQLYGEMEEYFHMSYSALRWVVGLTPLPTYCQGKNPFPQSQSKFCEEGKDLLSLTRIKPRPSSLYLVAIPTELPHIASEKCEKITARGGGDKMQHFVGSFSCFDLSFWWKGNVKVKKLKYFDFPPKNPEYQS